MSQLKDIISQLQALDAQYHRNKHIENISEETEDCCICLDEINKKKNNVTLECGHSLHLNCFLSLMLSGNQSNGDKCPLCRSQVLNEDMKSKLSSGNNNLNKNDVMMLTTIQKRIVQVLRDNAQYAYTPQRVADKIHEAFDTIYPEKNHKN